MSEPRRRYRNNDPSPREGDRAHPREREEAVALMSSGIRALLDPSEEGVLRARQWPAPG